MNEAILLSLYYLSFSAGSWHTTYTRVPHYITNYQRSLALESLEYAVFDMTLQDSVTIEINSSVMTGRIITGKISLTCRIFAAECSTKGFMLPYHIR